MQRAMSIPPLMGALLFAAGCAGASRERPIVVEPPPPLETSVEEPASVEVIGDTLIYTVRWGRAENLAETLRRVYPNAIVVAHPETNQLLIRAAPPPVRERGPILEIPR